MYTVFEPNASPKTSLFARFLAGDPVKIEEAEQMIARNRRRDTLLARALFGIKPTEPFSYHTEEAK